MTQSENKEGSTLFGGVTTTVRSQVPPAAKWLGASGVIPFITLAIAVLFLEGADQEAAYFAIAAYGAVILSFLGGIHWGLAVADGDQVVAMKPISSGLAAAWCRRSSAGGRFFYPHRPAFWFWPLRLRVCFCSIGTRAEKRMLRAGIRS